MTDSPLEHVKLHLVDSIDALWAMKSWAGERRETPLGFDTETGGLSIEKDRLRLIQLGDLTHGWAVPFEMWGGGALEILEQYEGPLVGHNVPFDTRFIGHHAGWQPPWHRIHDTMTMAHLVNPRGRKGKMMSAGLKQLGDSLIDPRASAGQAALDEGMRKQHWTWATVPLTFKPYWIYGALDPVLTCHIWQKLQPEVMSSFAPVYDFERAVSRVLAGMMARGMMIDVPYTQQKIADITTFSEKGREWLDQFGINSPMSSLSIAKVIENYGQEILWRTEHGAPQMDKEALGWYRDNAASPLIRELCETVLTLRHAEKMKGTYLENLLRLRDYDEAVHASIWSLGARTSRMSITDPALQTLPRDDLIVRGCFVPRPGNVLISIDADQIEARLAAHFSGDQGLIDAFLEADQPGGRDFFCGVASEIFRTEITKQDKRRQHTKNTVYGSLYGAGPEKMALTAGVTLDIMAPIKKAFDIRFPGLKELQNRVLAEAKMHDPQCVYTPMGRRLLLDNGREYTQGTNALIQGHASEILKKGLLDLDAAGFGDSLLLPVHDELILEVGQDDAEAALQEISKVLTNRSDYAVPITWDGKIMKERWVKT